jgi:hypothetical protein
MAKSAEVPGMCTAADRPFKPSGDLMLALPMMKYGNVFIWLWMIAISAPASLALITAVPTAPL